MRVLVADDSSSVRRALVSLLGKEPGIELREATSGKEAVAVAVEWRPHLIFIDMVASGTGLPGVDAIKQIKGNAKCGNPDVVLVTSETDARTTAAGYAAGAKLIYTKPFRDEDILGAVRLLGRNHKQH